MPGASLQGYGGGPAIPAVGLRFIRA